MIDAQDTEPQTPTPLADSVVQTAGGLLRQARERQGIALERLASSIKISTVQLQDLEADRFDRLSHAAFIRALALSICRNLKIDAGPVLALLPPTPSMNLLEQVNKDLNVPFDSNKGLMAWLDGATQWGAPLRWILVAAAAVLLVGGLWVGLKPWEAKHTSATAEPHVENSPSAVNAAPLQSASEGGLSAASGADAGGGEAAASAPAIRSVVGRQMPAASAALAAIAAPVAASEATSAAAVSGALQLLTRSRSWVEVKNASGKLLVSRLIRADDKLVLDVAPPLNLIIGNAADAQVIFRGQTIDLTPYTRDQVAHLELKP